MKTFLMLLISLMTLAHAVETPITKTMKDKDLKWGPCPEIFPKGCEISVLHGDPKQKGADVFLRVPGNYIIPAHTHTSAEHMTLVAGNLEVKYKDKEAMVLSQGSYAYGPANHAHEARCTSTEACVLLIGFDEPIDAKIYNGKL